MEKQREKDVIARIGESDDKLNDRQLDALEAWLVNVIVERLDQRYIERESQQRRQSA